MADDAAATIQRAAAGLLYPSESDAPFDPVRWDAGMADWNYSWETWQQGNLNG